ncbi:MAG: stage 0 sporulation family protein [Slackia sp.]
MPNVAAVRLTYNPKVLWFDPNGVEFRAGDALIVRTERGLEYGIADEDLKEVDKKAIENLKCALKPVERKATVEDQLAWKEMQAKAEEALPVFKQMVAEQKLDMHPVTVEFLFDGDKAVFYFEAEDRVDFRELVRVLAARFHVRIDMRQIGVRDEARIVGGLGHCGQELCCKRLGGEFNPVSIRMAKDRDRL